MQSENTTSATNLVVVCCHAVYLGGDPTGQPSQQKKDAYLEPQWQLAPFQRSTADKPGEHETFISHLSAALSALTQGSWADDSVVVFSGGHTSNNRSLPSEARSYLHAAFSLPQTSSIARKWFGTRLFLEEDATDSYQNLLFSIIRFRKETGRYPERIRVITHAFKARRFLDLHGPAIRWPAERIQVQGIDPISSATDYSSTVAGELANGYTLWSNDPYGQGAALAEKRKRRFWGSEREDALCGGLEPDVCDLVRWRGATPAEMFGGSLPWDE